MGSVGSLIISSLLIGVIVDILVRNQALTEGHGLGVCIIAGILIGIFEAMGDKPNDT
jgi:hypothetical protein